jgi:hypothetical protein
MAKMKCIRTANSKNQHYLGALRKSKDAQRCLLERRHYLRRALRDFPAAPPEPAQSKAYRNTSYPLPDRDPKALSEQMFQAFMRESPGT